MNKTLRSLLFLLLLVVGNAQAQQFRRIEILADLNDVTNNNGIAVADYDNDNDLDIFVVGESKLELTNTHTWSRLLRNNNDGSFEDVTAEAGFLEIFNHELTILNGFDLGDKMGVSWVDYNNDTYPDIFLTNAVQSQLYHNNGDGTFSNVTVQAGFEETCNDCYLAGALWFDYDNDGNLDVYLSDYNLISDNKLYRNLGNGTFALVSDTNLGGQTNSLSAIAMDFNQDGYQDIYVANDFDQNNFLLINQSGNGFIEQAQAYGIEDPYDGMGLAVCDFDNNGLFDFVVTNIHENSFYVNNGDNTFTNKAEEKGIYDTDWAWGANFSDFNHDGYEDFFVTNGFANFNPNAFFINESIGGSRSFISEPLTANPIEESQSRSTVSFDYDNDGDLDLLVTNFNGKLFLYENTAIDTYFTSSINGNWLKINLEGTVSNRNAFGTKIKLETDNGDIQHRFHMGSAYLSHSIQSVHFGVKAVNHVALTIYWPSGIIETYNAVPVNNTLKIVEGLGYTIQDTNTAIKIPGCTDINSCNYDENATVNDFSCEYLQSGNIYGNTSSAPLTIEEYNYTPVLGNYFNWEVVNGEILSGQGTNTVQISWGIATQGIVSITHGNDNCQTQKISLIIALDAEEPENSEHSVARLWNEVLLEAIRNDYARPTIHARNLFHTSIAMYDAWAIYDEDARTYLLGNNLFGFQSNFSGFTTNENVDASIRKTISHAAFTVLKHRFAQSPNAEETLQQFDDLMDLLGYDHTFSDTNYTNGNPAALGNYIGNQVIQYGLQDGANEQNYYENMYYQPVNNPLIPTVSGNATIINPNRWQPLALDVFIDQAGNVIDETTPEFLSPEWGNTLPFALTENTLTNYQRDSNNYKVYHDPGAPPFIGEGNETESNLYKWGFSLVSIWQSHLDPSDGVIWDISPKSIGNISINDFPTNFSDFESFYNTMEGGDIGTGHEINPVTNAPYQPQMVPRGDYARILAEFWADGPDSETPPGHWFVLLNYVNDHPLFEKKFKGEGEILDDIEWDVKAYFILGGTMHDAAVSAWGIKGWYDYVRPISAIRYMADMGQSTNASLANYHENGILLVDNYIEVVTEGDALAGTNNEHVGKIKLYTWKGHDYIEDTEIDQAGVGWILAENWWPYQRPSFITPPFAGYVSGHSTYSRAAAEALTLLTGTPYFPGGLGEFNAKKNEFLVFEEGPSLDITLQWATYRDASDQCSLSRIWGGIHPPMDDIPGRLIGEKIGVDSFHLAESYFYPEKIIEETTDLKLFPNPIVRNNILTITGLTESPTLALFNIYGQYIPTAFTYNNETNTAAIDISDLATGIYLLRSNKKTWKLIVQ